MKITLFLYSLSGIIFSSILILLYLKITENNQLSEELDNLNTEIFSLRDQISINSYLTADLLKAKEDLKHLNNKNKLQDTFWSNFVSHQNNVISDLKVKSTSFVQAEITRLITYLRSRCKSSKVLLFETPVNFSFTDAFGTSSQTQKDFLLDLMLTMDIGQILQRKKRIFFTSKH